MRKLFLSLAALALIASPALAGKYNRKIDVGQKAPSFSGIPAVMGDQDATISLEDAKEDVMDAGLICAAQKVEHYEIATYGCLRTYAEMLGFDEQADLLQETLDEEKDTDENLTELAVSCINLEAEEGEDSEEEEEEKEQPARGRAK